MEEGRKSFLLAKVLMWMPLHRWSANAPWGEDTTELEEFHLLAISCILAAGLCQHGTICSLHSIAKLLVQIYSCESISAGSAI